MSESVFTASATAAGAPDRSPHLTVTRLRLHWSRLDALVPFFRLSLENARAAEHAEGFLGGALWVDAQLSFWTLTLWDDAASMNAYAYGPTHLRAIEHLRRYRSAYCEAAFAGGLSPTPPPRCPTRTPPSPFSRTAPYSSSCRAPRATTALDASARPGSEASSGSSPGLHKPAFQPQLLTHPFGSCPLAPTSASLTGASPTGTP